MPFVKTFILETPKTTQILGELFGKKAYISQVITLTGDLGTGKTTFAQGFAKGLNIQGIVNSPTFTLVKPYFESKIPLYHIDAYRLEDTHQDLGFEEYIEGNGVCLIEWPQFINELIPPNQISIQIERFSQGRKITATAYGKENEEVLKEVIQLWDMH